MKIFILGVGDAFSSANYNVSFIIQGENGFNLAIECPHPYLKILRDIRKINKKVPDISNINNFLITHLHSDHCSGLETLGFYKKSIENKKLGVAMGWNDHLKHQDMLVPSMGETIIDNKKQRISIYEYFNYSAILDLSIGPFTIKSRATDHYIPANAVLITENNKTLGFSGDTKFDLGLLEWLDQADFILHETGPAPGHTPLENLLTLPKHLKRKIRLIHYSDSFHTNEFTMARQGETICIG